MPQTSIDALGDGSGSDSGGSSGSDKTTLVAVHPDFRVVALALPVPPYAGRPLDPPLRSRFQSRSVFSAPSQFTSHHLPPRYAPPSPPPCRLWPWYCSSNLSSPTSAPVAHKRFVDELEIGGALNCVTYGGAGRASGSGSSDLAFRYSIAAG